MKELIEAMATDMNIIPYANEEKDLFLYRLCYSALGLWCLKTAENQIEGKEGTTKHHQTITINTLIKEYCELFPSIADRFTDRYMKSEEIAVHIRRVYEEMGYLLTDDVNNNRITKFGRGLFVGDEILYFGLPQNISAVNGLGVFAERAEYYSSVSDILIRDNLTPSQYLDARYDDIDFHARDIDDELEFFDPLAKSVPSAAWGRQQPDTELFVARKGKLGPYYRVIKTTDNTLIYAEEKGVGKDRSLTDCEYRRLYFALKEHYNNPLIAKFQSIDSIYSKVSIPGHLPNREYYFMLMVAWPSKNAFEKCEFIIKKSHIPMVKFVLKNIGIKTQG